jgi:CheY-like chemotaxis protein
VDNEHDNRTDIVLVAEDETLLRLLASDILTEAGYRVLDARDGQEALTILQVQHDVKALVTDVNMPNVDGLSLAKIVSEQWPSIAIVVVSALSPPAGLPPQAHFVSKPYEPTVLIKEINTALGKNEDAACSAPIALTNLVNPQAGQIHGAGGLAQPLPEPEE